MVDPTINQIPFRQYHHLLDRGTDSQIDALAYELYGLTEEEIKIVEGA